MNAHTVFLPCTVDKVIWQKGKTHGKILFAQYRNNDIEMYNKSSLCMTAKFLLFQGGSAPLDLIYEDFVYCLKNKATLDKVSNGAD